jgi:hypothetical protein
VGEIWRSRACAELATASVSEHVARAARELGAPAAVCAHAEQTVSDELRHAELCRGLAEHYLGLPTALPARQELEAPVFGKAPERINAVLLLVYHSCINEGIAVAYLQENLRLAQAPAVRRVLHQLLRDDVVHARIGWAYLASGACDADARRHVRQALPTLLRIGTEAWLRADEGPDLDRPAHGCLGLERHPAIVSAAIEGFIVPGFAHAGVGPGSV